MQLPQSLAHRGTLFDSGSLRAAVVSYIREAVVFGLPTYLSTAISHHPFSPAVIGWPVSCLKVELIEEGCFLDLSPLPSALPPLPVTDIQRPFAPGAS